MCPAEKKRAKTIEALKEVLDFNGWEKLNVGQTVLGYSLGSAEIYFPSSPEKEDSSENEVGFTNGENVVYCSLEELESISVSYIVTEKAIISLAFEGNEESIKTDKMIIYPIEKEFRTIYTGEETETVTKSKSEEKEKETREERHYFDPSTPEEIRDNIIGAKLRIALWESGWDTIFVESKTWSTHWENNNLKGYSIDLDNDALKYSSPHVVLELKRSDILDVIYDTVCCKNGATIKLS